MNCDSEDVLNIDIDPDFLISLVGKLSLNNIPDFSDTLQSLENNTGTSYSETEIQQNAAGCVPSGFGSSTLNQSNKSLSTGSLNSSPASKDGFLSSIGLFSSTLTSETKTISLAQDHFQDDASAFCNSSASDSKGNKDSCRVKEKLPKIKDISTRKNTCRKKCNDSNIHEKRTCDGNEFHWPALPLFPSDVSFPHKSVDSLEDVFSHHGMVYDIQLNDIGGSLELPFQIEEETDASANSLAVDSCEVHCVPQLGKSEDFVEKSVCSPDSGISTSPCPSAVSPCSPPIYLEYEDDPEEYDRLYEDDLGRLLAELIEIENSLRYSEMPQSSVNVPVLKDAKNPEDHKEKLLNFLKEPLFTDLKCQLSLLKEDEEQSCFPEHLVENCSQSAPVLSSKDFKKPSPRSKKHKLGFEFKYAAKNELRHSSIFSKEKHFPSRNKILKQIQDDERIQKQVKLIQKLIVSKKLKRTDHDDRENKKRRIQLTDSCFQSQQENSYK